MLNNSIKISVVIPTLNEEDNIKELITCIENQTFPPDEIIICDGNSSDRTIEIVKKLKEELKNLKIVKRIGKCRGAGRNSGIDQAKNNYIALIDAGTKPHENWLEQLKIPIEKNNEIQCVYGSIAPYIYNTFSLCMSAISIGKESKKGKIIKSVSSILITKNLWKVVGKFPVNSDNNYIVEDLIFLEKIKKSGLNFKTNSEAIVEWKLANSIPQVFKKYYEYFSGGLETGHAKKYSTTRNLFFYIFSVILSFYLSLYLLLLPFAFHSTRTLSYINNSYLLKKNNIFFLFKNYVYVFFILMTVDLATYIGLIEYYLVRKWKKFQ